MLHRPKNVDDAHRTQRGEAIPVAEADSYIDDDVDQDADEYNQLSNADVNFDSLQSESVDQDLFQTPVKKRTLDAWLVKK